MNNRTNGMLLVWTASIYLFLYIPIAVLVIFSFNDALIPYQWQGFSTRWYYDLFHSTEVWFALQNSLIVACSSVLLSLFLGLTWIFYAKNFFLQRLSGLFYLNLASPEIVLAVGLLMIFALLSVPFGLTTLITAHTVIGLGYVIPIIQARFAEIDTRIMEASLDLGATHLQTLIKVVMPMLLPSITASALLVFIISLDDFVLSFFCAGASTQTLPLYIFAVIRSGATPMVNALSTLLFMISGLFVLFFTSIQSKEQIY